MSYYRYYNIGSSSNPITHSISNYGPSWSDYSNCWGKIVATYYTEGDYIHFYLTSYVSNYPFMRAALYVNGTWVYDSGYCKSNYSTKAFPRGNRTSTTWLSAYIPNLGSSHLTVQVGVGVSIEDLTWSSVQTTYRSYDTIYGAWFYHNNTQIHYTEAISGQSVSEPNNPTKEGYNFTSWKADPSTSSITKLTADTTFTSQFSPKESTLKLNPNGGFFKDKTNSVKTLVPKLKYDSTQWNNIKEYQPTKIGYKFLGWYTSESEGIQIYDENCSYCVQSNYWDSDGKCKRQTDLTLYAHWEIQNVTYINTDNGLKLSTIYIKTEESNKLQPAIIYIWNGKEFKQSIVKE